MKFKQVVLLASVSFCSAFVKNNKFVCPATNTICRFTIQNILTLAPETLSMNFTKAVSEAIAAVVHIKTKIPAQDIRACSDVANDFLSQLLGLELRTGYMPE